MRVTVLKAAGGGVDAMIAYYAGLAQDQQSRDGAGRGPVDYYLDPDEPPGQWFGAGCSALGLAGAVTPEAMTALLGGRDPDDGSALGRAFSDHSVRGFDATFSAPKSVSLLWALCPDPFVRAEVLAAHDAAVEAALTWLERHGAVTRRGKDGVLQVDTRGLTVARFRQHTSRTADPQLHTHAVISSKVQDTAGRWLALDARFLLQQQRGIGWVYDAALRSEMTARLGVGWGVVPPGAGQSDVFGVPEELIELFSQRRVQVEETLAELLREWVDEHEGQDPDRWVIASLTRKAVLASRPAKQHGVAAETLRGEWATRASAAGYPPLEPPQGPRGLPRWDPDQVIADALEALAQNSSHWLAADLAREVAARLPATAAPHAAGLTALVDELTARALTRCVELHPPAPPGEAVRADGRPVTEAVTDRRFSGSAILEREARLLAWARGAHARGRHPAPIDAAHLSAEQRAAAGALAGTGELMLVVGPAGTGKTTTLAAAVSALAEAERPVIGLAPSGKAADVLAREAGCHAATLAKLLVEYSGPGGPEQRWTLTPGTTVIVDEAGMASTLDLDRLVALAREHRWRLAFVGDPGQLPAVGPGGVFAHWCATLPAHELDEPRRFVEPWEAEASLRLRAGEKGAVDEYAAHGRVVTVHPSLVGDLVAREYRRASVSGGTVAITTVSEGTARAINAEIQRRLATWRSGPGVVLHDGTRVFAGDTIATRKNNRRLVTTSGAPVRNRQDWKVTTVRPDGGLDVFHPERGRARLPAPYVARYVQLGWAVTGYGTQGITTDEGINVVEPSSTRAGVYVGMTRGRRRNLAVVLDPSGGADPAAALAEVVERTPRAITAHMMRERLYRQQGVAPPGMGITPEDPIERIRRRLDALEASPKISRGMDRGL
ncbi:MAG: relaxase domain-containing protein [Actinobacteria bacterium]|nr:relaxase domain-containing protein [Actinomycetota bacterium]